MNIITLSKKPQDSEFQITNEMREEAFQKVRAGFRADLGHPCSQSVVKWRNADLIVPIDTSRLKNWGKVDPGFASMEGFQVDGVQWALPIDWGATALTYNADEVTEAETKEIEWEEEEEAEQIRIMFGKEQEKRNDMHEPETEDEAGQEEDGDKEESK